MTPDSWVMLGHGCRTVAVLLYVTAFANLFMPDSFPVAVACAAVGIGQSNAAELCYIKAYLMAVKEGK